MGNWDDESAFINAFHDAISKFKKMHGIGQLDGSKAGEQDTTGTAEDLSTCADENNNAKREANEDINRDVASHSKPDPEETSNELPSKENQQEPNWNSSNLQDEQNAHQSNPSTKNAEDYNLLLSRYNEIEEQRLKIMQEFEHFNYGNFQEPGPSQHWGAWGSPQQYPVMPGQINHPLCYPVVTNQSDHSAVAPTCCPVAMNQPNHSILAPPYDPYFNQCMVAPCYLGGTCTSVTSGIACNAQSTFREDSNVTKAALSAAEKAISSSKIESPEKQEKGRKEHLEASAAGQTDLNAVFNAWYTAGFYTGKYLAEHSIAKKRQG